MNTLQTARLAHVVADIRKRWGNDALVPLSERANRNAPPTVATGLPALDALLGGHGLPCGQLIELTGSLGSGVATLALFLLAHAQRESNRVAYFDLAQTFDATYAARCGIDLARLLIVRPNAPEEAFDIAHELIADYGARLLVLDLTFLSSAEARLVASNAAFRRATVTLHRTSCAVLCLTRPGASPVPVRAAAGLCLTTLGGARWWERGGQLLGCEVRIAVSKQKQGPAGRQATLNLTLDRATGGSM